MIGHNVKAEIRVVIADDQTLFAEGLKTILESRAPDIQVVGIARDGNEAVELTRRLSPDIVLMDVRMPGMDGVDATKKIHEAQPDVHILVLTTFDDDEYVKHSLAYGAIGYLLKNRPPAELIDSIHAVQNGILQIDPGVAKTLIHHVREPSVNDDDILKSLTSLTHRDRDVLELLIQAYDNRQIAETMSIAEQTVRNYISGIYSKPGIVNRIEIMRYTERIKFYLEHYFSDRK